MAKQEEVKKAQKVATQAVKVVDSKKNSPKVVEEKKSKQRKVLKKIENFNKYHKLRTVKELRRRKDLSEKLTIEPALLLKAAKCLQKFIKEQKAKSKFLLEEEDEFIYIEVTLSKLPDQYSIRPFQM